MSSTHCGPEDDPDGRGAELLVQLGPTLQVDIGLDATARLNDPDAKPALVLKDFSALIDTGATGNCIDSGVAIALNLPIVDQALISGVLNAPEYVNVHLAQIYIHGLDHTFVDRFAAVDLAGGGQLHRILLGRSFLQHFNLTYDGTTGVVMIGHPGDLSLPRTELGTGDRCPPGEATDQR